MLRCPFVLALLGLAKPGASHLVYRGVDRIIEALVPNSSLILKESDWTPIEIALAVRLLEITDTVSVSVLVTKTFALLLNKNPRDQQNPAVTSLDGNNPYLITISCSLTYPGTLILPSAPRFMHLDTRGSRSNLSLDWINFGGCLIGSRSTKPWLVQH